MITNSIIEKLIHSNEPAVRLKTYTKLLDFNYNSAEIQKILVNIKEKSSVISNLFSFLPKNEKDKDIHVYKKFQGAHWILSILADIGYPKDDETLKTSMDWELNWLLGGKVRPIINGRRRFCASQEGNGLYSALRLGFYDERCDDICERLVKYQWVDGGWNCDKNPDAKNSSYHESLIPTRALNYYQKEKPTSEVKKALEKATELFLRRKLFKRLKDDKIINLNWLLLHYPPYWHYDILMAMKILAEIGKITDKRCTEALDILEAKRLPDGGFPLENRYCQSSNSENRYYTPANWGSASQKKMNEWITIDALFVLKEAKRIDLDY